MPDLEDTEILRLAQRHRIPVQSVKPQELQRYHSGERSFAIIAEVSPFEYAPYDTLVERCLRHQVYPVFLDSIEDPQNLGSIIRTLACMGGFSLVIPAHRACPITETVLQVASGGENHLAIAQVTNLAQALQQACRQGVWIAGAVVRGGEDITAVSLPFPCGIVIGSEGKGIRPVVDKQLEMRLSLPMRGVALTYNAAVACGMFCFEITRQKNAQARQKKA